MASSGEKNIFLELEYIGTSYFGFQIQNKKNRSEVTVQKVLEDALQKLFGRKIRVVYSSRTDRGVHARGQAVNFTVNTGIALQRIKSALNSFLPSDVYIKKIRQVPLHFHSRFDAKTKVYRYIILNKKKPSVFLKDFSWHIGNRLNLETMKKSGNILTGLKDFSALAKEAKKYKDCLREIKKIEIKKKGSLIYIDIEATGFLRNMARNIVYLMVNISAGSIDIKQIDSIINKKADYVNKPAPPQGLYLQKVNYINP
ncbi:MAG: tRNA pseudouridine(38-40) synthase TruA [Candidatus Omnitrophica bacterium]|nr:tRNA pseudouridine(38-40) synthase TruA [Candidatus Omnitrophota bacterium]MBD3269814.1 tRNA pseudouridine(38-40) synthase TruA [Candidatus Omnitrophota bacterium]